MVKLFFQKTLLAGILSAGLLVGCQGKPPNPVFTQTVTYPPTNAPTQPPLPAQSPSTTPPANAPTLAPAPANVLKLWVSPAVPAAVQAAVHPPAGVTLTTQPEEADFRLEVGSGQPISTWVYALVVPFPTATDGVNLTDLKQCWNGHPQGPFAGQPLHLAEDTLAAFTAWWGQPAPGAVKVTPSDQFIDSLWANRPAWGILPFEALVPRLKVLQVDGLSPLHKDFSAADYGLSLPVSLVSNAPHPDSTRQALLSSGLLPASNRDASRLATVVMTGSTALVRAVASTMYNRGITYPGQDIRDWLRSADIAHISNEVSFSPHCGRMAPTPTPIRPGTISFPCSDADFIGLLDDLGTDVVEMTGDHFVDGSPKDFLYTLDLYHQRGWLTFGAGRTLAEGLQPITLERNGNRIAFIGCNAKGRGYAQAGPANPGVAACDFPTLQAEITRLSQEGYQVIASVADLEYFTMELNPVLEGHLKSLAKAGAVIVNSQSHLPEPIEFSGTAFIHYGLGNLFFDQFLGGPPFTQGFIDRHVFYAGKLIGTELLTIQAVNFARVRPLTGPDRESLLNKVFKASGW